MKYQVVIENFDEDFELIEEIEDLEKAIEFVKKYPREKYKAIMLYKVDTKTGKHIKEIEIEVR